MDVSFDSSPDDGQVPVTDRVTSSKTRRYLVAAALLGGGVTLGALFSPIGLANAQSDGTPTTDSTTSSTAADSSGTTADDSTDSTTADDADDDRGHGHGHGHGRGVRLEELATVFGLTVDELRTEIEADKSLADIAEAQGVSEDAVVEALLAHLQEHLDAAVADGRLEQSDVDAKLAEAETRIRENLDAVPAAIGRGGPGRGGPGGGFGDLGGVQELADSLGLDLDTLRSAVVGGQTLAEAAEAQGVSSEDLKAALITEATEHIDEALASGRIDQDRADELKSGLEARVDGFVNGTMAGGFGGRGHGGGRGGPGHHMKDRADDGTDSGSTTDEGDTQQSSYTA